MIVIILIAIDIHELAHAVVADRLGDRTPRRMGELSLNPFVHMDQVGLVLLVLTSLGAFAFTYGRTHVTPTNLKFGPQRGNALVAVAGPLSNLAVAAILGAILSLYAGGNLTFISVNDAQFLALAMVLNIILFVFNLIPIPPLDGFTVVGGFLSARQMYALAPLQQYGPMIILVLFFADPQIHVISGIVTPIRDHIIQLLCSACYG
jgi:Zn-dependent protease